MIVLLIGFLLFSSPNFAAGEACPDAVDHSCEGFSALEILMTGGECRGTAAASCKVVTRSQNEFQRAFADWWSSGARCEQRSVEAAATEIAAAVAKVWADVFVEVACGNQGFACGWVITNTISYSLEFAEAIAQAAGGNAGGEAARVCFADMRSVALVLAKAAAQSQEATCANAGDLPYFTSIYTKKAEPGITQGLLRAFSGICDGPDDVSSASRCSDRFSSNEYETKAKLGELCGGAGESMPCVGGMKELCCSRDVDQTVCTCMEDRCTNGPWMRRSDFDDDGGKKRMFQNQRGEVCLCTETK